MFWIIVAVVIVVAVGGLVLRSRVSSGAGEWSRVAAATIAPNSLPSSFTCIVTGSNTGIGLATAEALARGGAHVILACRDEQKANVAVDHIKRSTGNQHVEFMQLDLSSFESTRAFVSAFAARRIPLHVLISNAGLAPVSFSLGPDGYEQTWTVNHLSSFLLVRLMLPLLAAQSDIDSRIVMVNSGSHRIAWGLRTWHEGDVDYFRSERCFSKWMRTYAETKLASVLCCKRLAESMKEAGITNVTLNLVNPGPVNTDIARDAPSALQPVVHWMMNSFFKPPWKGAEPSLYAAVATEVKSVSGEYYDECLPCPVSFMAYDIALRERMWRATNQIVGTNPEDVRV